MIAAECARQGASIRRLQPIWGWASRSAACSADGGTSRIAPRGAASGGERRGGRSWGLLWHYDEPFADSSSIPSFALARALRGRYKVVLNGEGGDEAFGGYRHYEHIAAKQALKAATAAFGIVDGATSVYVESKTAFRQNARARLMNGSSTGNSLSWLLERDGYLVPSGTALQRAMWSDRHLYLPNDLTYKVDIALAGNGIENRAPFLDHRLLEWTQSLPAEELVEVP